MSQSHRIAGGLINRASALSFSFNGKEMSGYRGDTLASALLANGCRFVARSFKYHRPRGIYSAGSEEPSALVQLRHGAFQEPNTRATVTELYNGLDATSQNHRGSLRYDLMAVNDLFAPFLSAGFYYKTFMWPKAFWEKFYEPAIRASAGLGSLSGMSDPDHYDKEFLHCDVLIIGAGAAGLSAALTAAESGARVIIADEDYLPGGRLNMETYSVNGVAGADWAANTVARLADRPNIRFMTRTTIFGAYDHGIFGALRRNSDHLNHTDESARQTLFRIYAKRSILCSGATERGIAFGNNDRPGVMLAGAVRGYANRWAVAAGKRIAVFTNSDDGWRSAADLYAKGVEVAAIVDTRDTAPVKDIAGAEIIMGGQVVGTRGRHGLKSIQLSDGLSLRADCLAVTGGWNPNVHLTCHQRGRPVWNDGISAFVPGDELPPGMYVAGAANGILTLGETLRDGWRVARDTLQALGIAASTATAPLANDESCEMTAFWQVGHHRHRAWLDLQNDVTVKDVKLAHQEGYRSVELLKRYTTLGMATDQGKTANVTALAILAECNGRTIAETGTTIFRPPYTPIPIAAFAGRSRGRAFRPRRLTPSHRWALEQGAVMTETGLWMRTQWFPQAGETEWRQSVDREVLGTRGSVGVCDVTSLGKIDIQGKDATTFVDRVYCNAFAKLAVGKVRYGLMLREDGLVMDDGTTARLAENHYLMTTTTANAVSVFRHLEFCSQCLWPTLDVHFISVTEQWAQFAVAGPNSRMLLQKIVDPEFDISNQELPFMGCREVTVCGGTPARLFRISFSGELAFEVAAPTRYGDSLFRTLMSAGREYNAMPYGTEALGVMRIEKGHAAGNELNGQTTAANLGMVKMVSNQKDCIGAVLSQREHLTRDDRHSLMGFRPLDRNETLSAGAHLIAQGAEANTENDEGWLSSAAYSPSLQHSIGLGFIKRGLLRSGEVVRAVDPIRGKETEVEIVSPNFIDPNGERLRG